MGNREPGITLNNAAGEQLDKARRVRRMTFEELGARSGIAKNSAHRYLHGERVINMVTLESLCLALDVAPAAIIATAARKRRRTRRPQVADRDAFANLVPSAPRELGSGA